VVHLIVRAGPRRAVRRLVTILRREAAAAVSAALLHFADACCAAGVAIPPAGNEPRNFGLGRFPETTTRVRALEALAPGAGHRAAAADEAPGPASLIRCA